MTRKLGILAAVVATLAITTSVAMAALTFHSGPDVEFSGNSATATFNISGLGNDPASARLDIVGSAPTFCHNGGKNAKIVPGQNPTLVGGTSGDVDLEDSDKNGRDDVVISATAGTPTTPTPAQAGCPNSKSWTVSVGAVTVVSATLTITYDGEVIFSQTYTP